MSWELISNGDGDYIYNWVAVQQIARNYARAQAMLDNSTTKVESHWNPLVPNITTVDVNFAQVRKDTDQNSAHTVGFLRQCAANSAIQVRGQLLMMLHDTPGLNWQYQDRVRNAQHQTMNSISSAVTWGERSETVAKGVRDASGEILMIGASVSTGGAASGVFLLVAGPTLKGVAKYQDTGSAASAGIEFAVDLGMNKFGKFIDGAEKRELISKTDNIMINILASKVANSKDVAQAWVEKQSVSEALAGATFKAGTTGGTELAKSGVVSLLEESKGSVSGKALLATSALALTAVAIDRITEGITRQQGSPSAVLPKPAQFVLLDSIVLDEAFLDQFAMRKVTDATCSPSNPPF